MIAAGAAIGVFRSALRAPSSALGLLAFLVLLQLDDDFLVVHLDGLLDHADLLGEVGLERYLHAVGVEVVAAGDEGIVFTGGHLDALLLAGLELAAQLFLADRRLDVPLF